jgi:mRNA interferase RelE/StbE
MIYTIFLKRSAEKELESLPALIHEKIINAIINLEKNPRPYHSKKLYAHEGYRIKVGKYRILYSIDDKERKINILSVAHRKDAYR